MYCHDYINFRKKNVKFLENVRIDSSFTVQFLLIIILIDFLKIKNRYVGTKINF